MAAVPKMVLVDGTALIYRAYYAIPSNLCTSTGIHTNATYGFANMFRKIFAARKPDFGAVIFDAPGSTFRDERYADYKATREAMPEQLTGQLPWIDKLVDAFRFPRYRVPGYEADDVIGTLARAAADRGMEVLIVSGDKDFAQVITERVRMLEPIREVTFDPELVRKKWGVPPKQFVDFLALTGDKIDNIPGVPGIGAKGAADLLTRFGHLEGIFEHREELTRRQQKALIAHRDDALLSRELATIDTDVPLTIGIEQLALPPPDPENLNALFKELEFFSFLTEGDRVAAETEDPARHDVVSAEDLRAFLAQDSLETAIEPIYEPENAPIADFVGMAFCRAEGASKYLPLPENAPLPRPLVHWLSDASRPKLVHNAKKLHILLLRRGVAVKGIVGDTMLASFLIDPTKLIPHRLDQISKEYLQRTLPPRKRLVGTGQSQVHPRTLDSRAVAAHVGQRAETIIAAWPHIAERLDAEGQRHQMLEQDLPVARVLAEVEAHGILVDAEDLDRLGEEFRAELGAVESQVHALAGRSFNLASTKQLSQVLFEELGLPVLKKTKTGYSTAVDVLERLAKDHEIAELILAHRKLAKLISTYTNVLADAVQPATGRIHADWQQTASQTGRLISTDPDLQRTPIRTPEGKRIRKAFIAPPGHQLLSADWSQIELRVLAHVSGDELLRSSFRDRVDVHRRTAGQLFGVAPDAVSPEQRGGGKTVNFATIYGQGATALGQILGVPRKQAQAYIESYFEAYAGVRTWLDRTIARAHETGYVTTIFGRRRYIPELTSNSFMERTAAERIAANTPIQGSAADICLKAMIDIDRRLREEGLKAKMIMQIHDELVFEVPDAELEPTADAVQDVMENVVELDVPLVADVGSGPTWAAAH